MCVFLNATAFIRILFLSMISGLNYGLMSLYLFVVRVVNTDKLLDHL
jgi:hypothetical protein